MKGGCSVNDRTWTQYGIHVSLFEWILEDLALKEPWNQEDEKQNKKDGRRNFKRRRQISFF